MIFSTFVTFTPIPFKVLRCSSNSFRGFQQLEDFKESSQTQDDADVILALFDPMRYKVADPSGYDLNKLKDEFGAKYFRSVRLIKNSYGEDDIRIGLGFLGQAGIFKELPKRKDITDSDYQSVVNKTFFLNK